MASPNQIFGRATIRVNGMRIPSLPGAKIAPGGVNRKAINGDSGVLGFSEETKEPAIECEVALKAGLKLSQLAGIVDASVLFEADSGQRYVLNGAWVTEAPEATGGDGKVALKFGGMSCDEL